MTWGQEVKDELCVECFCYVWEGRDWMGYDCVSECLPRTGVVWLSGLLLSCLPAEEAWKGLLETPSPSICSHSWHIATSLGWSIANDPWEYHGDLSKRAEAEMQTDTSSYGLCLHLLIMFPEKEWNLGSNSKSHPSLESLPRILIEKAAQCLTLPLIWYQEPQFPSHLWSTFQAPELGYFYFSHWDVSLCPMYFSKYFLDCPHCGSAQGIQPIQIYWTMSNRKAGTLIPISRMYLTCWRCSADAVRRMNKSKWKDEHQWAPFSPSAFPGCLVMVSYWCCSRYELRNQESWIQISAWPLTWAH